MEKKGKSKILGAAVVLLLVINVCMLVLMLVRRGGERNHPPPAQILIRALRFDNEQEQAFHKLRDIHIRSMNVCVEANKKYRDTLFSQLTKGENVARGAYADSIGVNQKRMELITFKHFADVRALCNDQQKIVFDELIREVVQKMSRRKLWIHKPGDKDTPDEQY